jgi:peptide deformylase
VKKRRSGPRRTCVQHELDHLDGVLYIDKAVPDTISWLIEEIDDEGEEIVALHETTPEEIKNAYKARRLPPKLHVPDELRKRIEE